MLKLALELVRRTRRLVPVRRRESWRREWEAEIRHAWDRAVRESDGGVPPLRVRLRILLRTINCVRDAAWLRRREWTMTTTWMDLRLAARALARSPGFALAVVGTLAVGIGVNAAIFSLLNGVVLSDLPYRDPGELVKVWHRAPGFGEGMPRFEISDGYFLRYRDESRSFRKMGAWSQRFMTLTGQGEPERIPVGRATPGLFATLGVPPAAGRLFLEEEGRPGGAPVALLGHGTWRSRFGGDPGVLGRTLTLNGVDHEIVGVAPAELTADLAEPRVWIPLRLDLSRVSPSAFSYSVVGRLREGVGLEEAGRDLTRVLYTMPEVWPRDMSRESYERLQMSTYVVPLRDDVVGEAGETLWILQGAVAVVLLIAWANALNLVVVRSETRSRELAVRRALGAGRLRLFGHLLSEGGLLAVAAGVLGLGLAAAVIRVFPAAAPDTLPRLGEVGVNGWAVGFTVALVGLSGLLLAGIPTLRTGGGLLAGLREGGRGGVDRGGPRGVRGGLVVGQVALSLVLLVGSGLLFRSFRELRSVDPGIRTEGLLTMQLTLNRSQYADDEEARTYWRQVTDRVRSVPGVESAALVGRLPLEQRGGYWAVWAEDRPLEPGEVPEPRMLKTVSTGYFQTLGIEVVEGRVFRRSDLPDARGLMVVNRTLARSFWPDESAVGKRLRYGGPDWRTVIGVVDDVLEEGLDEPPPPAFYALGEPEAVGWQTWSMHLLARADRSPTALVQPLQRVVGAVNPGVPITSVRTMEDVMAESTAGTAFTMMLMAFAAGVSLFLGAVGLYAVISYVVAGRTGEIGVRMALGAEAGRVRAMVLRQGMTLAVLGVVVGVGVSLAGGRLVESLLFQVSSRDPVTLAGVSALLLAIAALASFVPALRAARIDPVEALRRE